MQHKTEGKEKRRRRDEGERKREMLEREEVARRKMSRAEQIDRKATKSKSNGAMNHLQDQSRCCSTKGLRDAHEGSVQTKSDKLLESWTNFNQAPLNRGG